MVTADDVFLIAKNGKATRGARFKFDLVVVVTGRSLHLSIGLAKGLLLRFGIGRCSKLGSFLFGHRSDYLLGWDLTVSHQESGPSVIMRELRLRGQEALLIIQVVMVQRGGLTHFWKWAGHVEIIKNFFVSRSNMRYLLRCNVSISRGSQNRRTLVGITIGRVVHLVVVVPLFVVSLHS